MCLVSRYLVGMDSNRNVDKMSYSDKAIKRKKWNAARNSIVQVLYLTEVCKLRIMIKESSHTQYQNTYCMYLQPIAS